MKEESPYQEDIYSDLPHGSDDEHIYEEFEARQPVLRPKSERVSAEQQPTDEEKRKTITLNRNLQGLVKEKVQTYEGIIQGAEVVVTCPEDEVPKTCPDPSSSDPPPSFQIKSSSGASGDSKSPFDL